MIVGMQESMVDYPDKISVIVFTKTCKWNCVNCHNKKTIPYAKEIPTEKVLEYIANSRPLVQAVTISGGEPTEWDGLVDFIDEVKKLGLLVKLDTNGTNPDVLAQVLSKLDVVAMDIKTDLNDTDHYKFITRLTDKNDMYHVRASVCMLSKWVELNPTKKLIYRTTLLDPSIDIEKVKESMKNYKCTEFKVQSDIIY